MRCPSSVRRPSSVVNFSHFRILLWNCWTEFKEIWQEARTQHPLPSLCFWGRSEKQDGRPGLWLAETFSTSSLKLLNGILPNLSESKISTSSTKFVFLGRSEKQDGRPDLWLADTFSTSPLKPLNGIQQNLTGRKISTSSTKFVFSGRSEKQDGRPCLWLAETFSTSPLKLLIRIQRNLTGSKISTSSTKVPLHSIFEEYGNGGLPTLNQSQNFKNATFLPKLYIKRWEISYIFRIFQMRLHNF